MEDLRRGVGPGKGHPLPHPTGVPASVRALQTAMAIKKLDEENKQKCAMNGNGLRLYERISQIFAAPPPAPGRNGPKKIKETVENGKPPPCITLDLDPDCITLDSDSPPETPDPKKTRTVRKRPSRDNQTSPAGTSDRGRSKKFIETSVGTPPSSTQVPEPKMVRKPSLNNTQKLPTALLPRGRPRKVRRRPLPNRQKSSAEVAPVPQKGKRASPCIPSSSNEITNPNKVKQPFLRVPKTYFPIDTKGICILCYREHIVLNSKPVSKVKRQEFSARFCTLLLRHLKLDLQRNIVRPASSSPKLRKWKKVCVVLCEDCTLLARTFCDLYIELENVRLRLDACVRNLSEIVRIAGRIPCRIKAYQERMGMEAENPTATADTQPGATKGIAKVPTAKISSVALAKNFRREILRKSIKSRNNTFPQVSLRRMERGGPKEIGGACANLPVCATITKDKAELALHQLQSFTLAYAFTFTSLWLLAMLGGRDMKEKPLNQEVPFRDNSSLDIQVLSINPTPAKPTIVGPKPMPGVSPLYPTINANPLASISEQQPNSGVASDKELQKEDENQKRKTITITDSGNTVLLPHQVFKTDFVDESLMDFEFEDNFDFVDLADSQDEPDLFPSTDATPTDPISTDGCVDIPIETAGAITPKIEPNETEHQEFIIDLNSRTCKDCKINLSCRAELEKHRVFIHKLSCYVECPVCKQLFTSYEYLTRHRNSSEQCAIAGADEVREFETIAKPIFPSNNTVRGNKFCPMEGCFEVFLKEEALHLHLKAHGSFSCNYCKDKKQFDKGHDLALHEAEEHSGSNSWSGYKCSRCDFHVGSQSSFILHFLDTHLKLEVYQERCEICQKGFFSTTGNKTRAENKEFHFSSHHDIKGKDPSSVYLCEYCQAPFLRKGQLTEHEVQIHHKAGKMIKCNQCGLELINSTILEKHKLFVHSNMPAYEMEAQWKLNKSQQRQSLARKKIICGCGKVFSRNALLQIHIRKVHEGVQPEHTEDQVGQDENAEDHDEEQGDAQMDTTESQLWNSTSHEDLPLSVCMTTSDCD